MMMTGGRAAALIVGLPFAAAAAGFGAFNMVGNFAHASEHHEASYAWGGGAISVDLSSGSVRVEVGSSSTVHVAYTSHFQLKKPSISAQTANGGVQLAAKCPGWLFSGNCAVNYTLTVPASARLVVHTGNGSLRVADLAGGASLDTGNGSITFDNVGGAIDARTGNGSIHGSSVRSTSLQARTGNGSIGIAWADAPTSVMARTGNGSITLTVPEGTGPYDVETSTGNGSEHVSVPTATGAPSSITAHTGNGSITVRAGAS